MEIEIDTTKTPSRRLAEAAVDRLVEKELLSPAEAAKLLPKLADGTMRSEDWRLALELSDPSETEG